MRRIVAAVSLCFVFIGMIACGGGSSTPPPTPTPTPTPAAITVTPSGATVNIGGSQTFTANSNGVPVTSGVTWSTNGPGTIDAATGLYRAPSAFPGIGSNSATITATAGGKTGTTTATVVYPNDNAGNQGVPIKLGTSVGNVLDNNTANTLCCIGTGGSLLQRGTTLFILSNDHVLGRSGVAKAGEAIDQPGQAGCPGGSQGLPVANFTEAAALNPGSALGPAPSNVDAAIAQIVSTAVDPTDPILDLGAASPTSIAAAPPSGTPVSATAAFAAGSHVAKSGRTTGLTCSTIQAISVDNVQVDYDQSCNGAKAFTAVFNGQVSVAGGSFSAGGDSGSLIVTSDAAAPLALLFAGNSTSTVGNPILDSVDSQGKAARGVLSAFNNGTAPTIVGGAPHAVSCNPTAQAKSTTAAAQSAPVAAQQGQLLTGVRDRHAAELMTTEPAIRSVAVGSSADAPGQGALILHVDSLPTTRIPATVEGVRTQVEYGEGVTPPAMVEAEIKRGMVAKDTHRDQFLGRGFQGVGVGRSDDAPGETAIVVYTIAGEPHDAVPATIDGVRTKIIEGERFRASGWNAQLERATGGCSKAQPKIQIKDKLK